MVASLGFPPSIGASATLVSGSASDERIDSNVSRSGAEATEAAGPDTLGAATAAQEIIPAGSETSQAGTDTIYVPELVKPETEEKAESELILKEGPDIDVRFGKSLRKFLMSEDEETGEFSVSPSVSYDRVDGPSLFLHEEFSSSEKLYPRLDFMEGYAWSSEKWRYKLDFEQPLFSQNSFSFGASVYLITDTFDKEIIGNAENTLSSFFLKKDYRDYFEREGASVFVKQKFLNWNSVKAEYAEDTYTSLDVIARGVFYKLSRQFRPNPPVNEGKWSAVTAQYELDTRGDNQAGPTEYWHRLEYEYGRHKDEPCIEYTRLGADLRTYLNLSPGQYLSLRLKVGATPSGTLPFQKEFYVGGIGTLAAHAHKEFRGDHMILLNAEYAVNVVKRFQFILLTDAGKAWQGRDELKNQTLALDAGAGVGIDGGIRVFAAKNLQRENSEVVWTLRLQRTF